MRRHNPEEQNAILISKCYPFYSPHFSLKVSASHKMRTHFSSSVYEPPGICWTETIWMFFFLQTLKRAHR